MTGLARAKQSLLFCLSCINKAAIRFDVGCHHHTGSPSWMEASIGGIVCVAGLAFHCEQHQKHFELNEEPQPPANAFQCIGSSTAELALALILF
jgi:hypothetical protein